MVNKKNKHMKKIILLFTFLSLIVSSNLKANPTYPPPVTSELYFNNNDWTLELNFVLFQFGNPVSDSLVIITSTDTVAFKPGFKIPINTPILITKDSLLYPLSINKNGDFVRIEEKYNGSFYNLDNWAPFAFGNIANAQVSAPLPGQSIKCYRCYGGDYGEAMYYIVKDNHPTLGTDAFMASDSSSFSGYIYDSNHTPIPNLNLIGNIIVCPPYAYSLPTDINGHFSCQNLYSYIRHIYISKQFCNTIDTTFSIEPDSAYVMDFTFNNCYDGLNDISKQKNYSMQIFPNPGSENFTFQISAPELNYTNGLIKIYNIAGELVNIIPINKTHDSFASVSWSGKGRYNELPSGIYTCSFEINGNTVASQKLIIKK